jgi:gamma-glutamyltranspeptidase
MRSLMVMAAGAAGGSTIISTAMENVFNVIGYVMDVEQAVDASRIPMQ